MKRILSIILSIAMLLSMATVAFADGVDGPMQKAKIKVAISADFKPFEYYDENGKLKGFDVDLMNYIGERIGFDIEFVNMSFDKLIPAVVNGEVACAISAITVTEERDSIIDYSREYLKTYNITFDENGKRSTKYGEQYAIVFREGLSGSPYNDLTEPTMDETVYILIDEALRELSNDRTVTKLIEKYELNKPLDESTVNVEYSAIMGDGDPAAKTEDSETKTSDTSLAPPSDWAWDSVVKATDLNILELGKEYNFLKPITREEFCELIYNYCCNVLGMLSTSDGKRFNDTDNPKIEILCAMGIINGKSTHEFAPNDALTREEAAVILQRMINATVSVDVTELWFEFDDIDYISDWAMDAVQTMCNMNVMNGVGNNHFAPQEVYTTEQAIVTITRVYSAQTAKQGREDFGNEEPVGTIIGGADTPTQIVVTDTIEIDDFYVDEAIKLITESGKLAADRDFISLYTTNDEMTDKILKLGEVDFNNPKDIYYLHADKDQMIANIKALAGEDAENINFEQLEKLNKKYNFSTLASLINASYGAENLAALTILTNSRGYIMPKDFKDDFALFVQYEGDYSAIVSFYKYGDGVISASMSFVKNGDKDNVFSRIYEITSATGEDSIDVARVQK